MDTSQVISGMQQIISQAHIVELSYTLEESMPVWPTHARFGTVVYETYAEGAVSMHRQVIFGEHTGTHIDAPKHFFAQGKSVDQLDVRSVMGRGVKVDASSLAPCGVYTLEMLQEYERQHGAIQPGDIMMFRFGWEDRYGVGAAGDAFLQDWPGLGEDAARYLVEKKVACVGTDALALDVFGSTAYPSHKVLLGNGVPILENLTNLKQLPDFCFVIGLPNKIKGGSGSPIRMIAMVE